jgi:DNA-binding MarR family transcriptional regulator
MHFLQLNDNLFFSEGDAFMIDEIKKIFNFQKSTNIKCLHNEIRIIKEILENGPIASLDLMKKTGRSISGHNQDLKRLLDIGALEIKMSENDKRKRIYDLSENLRASFISETNDKDQPTDSQ